MSEITVLAISDGKRYMIPFHPEFESNRLQLVQQCFLPLIDYLKNRFRQDGKISITWDDDKTENQICVQAFNGIDLKDVIVAYNEYSMGRSLVPPLETKI